MQKRYPVIALMFVVSGCSDASDDLGTHTDAGAGGIEGHSGEAMGGGAGGPPSSNGGTAGISGTGGRFDPTGGASGGAISAGGFSAAGGAPSSGGKSSSGGESSAGGASPGSGGANPDDCPAAPPGVTDEFVTRALNMVNAERLAAGAGCITMISEINAAAQAHCDYYAANDGDCTSNAHAEVMSCDGYTGSSPGERMRTAGYMGRSSFEIMAFSNNPESALRLWINSVWHRIPVLNPWVTHMGYGHAERCDTMDFGTGTPGPDTALVFYPYSNQVGVPTTFHGEREGPEPPAPPTGWPSGVPINVYARDIDVTEHIITLENDASPIDHVWLNEMTDPQYLRDIVFMYPHTPLASNTTYRVQVRGTYAGGALDLDWTFTTE